MTRFTDGPAKGQVLCLKGSPIYLRVVQNGKTFDALDQPTDTPVPEEKLFAYVRKTHHGTVHLNRGSKGSGFFPMADYTFIGAQPDEAIMRDPSQWKNWCVAQIGTPPEK